MARGITIRLNRVEGMRLLAAKVRKGQDDYKTAKSALPQQARQVKAAILGYAYATPSTTWRCSSETRREIISVNSNRELWRMLQSPCEVK